MFVNVHMCIRECMSECVYVYMGICVYMCICVYILVCLYVCKSV